MSFDDGGRPSRESLREVKREYKQRQKAEKQRAKDAQAYWDGQAGRSTRRAGWKAPVAGAAALAVVAGGALLVLRPGPLAPASTTVASSASPSPHSSSTPKATPKATAPATDPAVQAAFEGTPARSWKKGFAGITEPTAHTIGIYRRVQVAAAYRMIEHYLAAATLDPTVLYQGKMQPVLVTLGPSFPDYATGQHAKYVSSHGKKGFDWLSLASRFHPGDWKAAAETRARGHISPARLVKGALRVDFTIVTAYWLKPAHGGAARAIVVRRWGSLDFVGYGPDNVWMQQWQNSWLSTASVCGSHWKYPEYLEAWPNRDAVAGAQAPPAGSAYDPSDPNAPPPTGLGCFTDTSGFAS